jgi:hypothetical protein
MKDFYIRMLRKANADELAKHSTLNHHVNGMDYLCLYRSPSLTFKIYFVETPTNPNAGFLVHPHSHRYEFDTTVLHGSLDHVLFEECDGDEWRASGFFPDVGNSHVHLKNHHVGLVQTSKLYRVGETYSVADKQVHSLRLSEVEPLILGLTQFEDVRLWTKIYLSPGANDKIEFSDRRTPTPVEYERKKQQILSLLESEQ